LIPTVRRESISVSGSTNINRSQALRASAA
jgi:hypothetical protein